MTESLELLFFDTFAHDNTEEINLDLVQFPKPVHVTEVRIIPLGARVQADFPGGVRLGATNPSQFQIEFFVNDLGKPGASTFESLGGFEYNQNGCINLDCLPEETVRRIPTDGLVLKGWYTTITLAVYGTLTNNITEQIVQPKVNPALPTQPNTIAEAQQILPNTPNVEDEWNPEVIQTVPVVPTEYPPAYPQPSTEPAPPQDFPDYFIDHPKDPRSYHNPPEPEWDSSKTRSSRTDSERVRDRSKERDRDRDRNHDKNYRDRDGRQSRDFHDRDKDWDRSSRTYRRSYNRDDRHGDERKRPRTPPQSPKRPPHTPPRKESDKDANISPEREKSDVKSDNLPIEETQVTVHQEGASEEPPQLDLEEFEPILSDEDILDEEMDDYGPYLCDDDLIKTFLPGVANLKRFVTKSRYQLKSGDAQQKSLDLDEDLKIAISIVDDFFKSSITKYESDTFRKLNDEIKEEFVHLCEKLFSIFQSQEEFSLIVEIYTNLTDSREKFQFDRMTAEIADQLLDILTNLSNWLRIALDYDLANSQAQPAYKIRHVKCGVRLVDFFSTSGDFLRFLSNQNDANLDEALLKLYDQEFMALSIKLMILKSLDSYLSHQFTVDKFLSSGYQILVEKLMRNPPVRLKFALNSVLKKLNLYESLDRLYQVLQKFHNSSIEEDWTVKEIDLISHVLSQILNDLRNSFAFTQPKRFLPVSAQFEIVRCLSSFELTVLMRFFANFKLLESFVLILTSQKLSQSALIKTGIFEILSELLATPQGLDYLKNNCETSNLLQKFLLMTFAESDEEYSLDVETKSRNLGMELAYKLETLYYLDILTDLGYRTSYDVDDFEVVDQLQGLYCLIAFNSPGRHYCLEVLSKKRQSQSLFKYLDNVYASLKDRPDLVKSPGLCYIVDVVMAPVFGTSNVEFLVTNLEQLKLLADSQYLFENCGDSVGQKLTELKCHLSPLLDGAINPLSYDNLGKFIEIIDKEATDSAFISSPGQLLTSLKVIHHFGISKYTKPSTENCLTDFIELKYKHVILQLFSLDGVAILTKLLAKITDHYQQPWLHQSSFVSNYHGDTIAIVMGCCVDLLKQMLTYVIKCRNTNFKDLTMLPVLFKVYDLAGNFPTTCGAAYFRAQKVCKTIVETLLTFTQPVATEMHEKDSLNRTLWTMMVGEVLRYVTSLPCTFLTGLSILSELLPLPLPILTKSPLTENECSWTVNLRKLWSVHLHPHSTVISDMVAKLSRTSNQQLLNLLRRVCVQIGDLAANSAQMIAKSVLNTVQESLVSTLGNGGKVSATNVRLLNFLACLVTHNTLKAAILNVLQSVKSYASLIQLFGQILTAKDSSSNHVQAQECVLSLVQTFCDVEVTLASPPQNPDVATSELYLANALPNKECLLVFVTMVLDHLSMSIVDGNHSNFVTFLPASRILLLLTEHDYGFCHLRDQLVKRHGLFHKLLSKLRQDFAKDSAECLSTLNTLTEFLRLSCSDTDDLVAGALPYRPRTMNMTPDELKLLLSWPPPEDSEDKHPLVSLESTLIDLSKEDATFESLVESLQSVKKLLTLSELSGNPTKGGDELVFPEAESLLVQFAGRSVYTSTSANDSASCHNDDVRMWLLSTQTDDGDCETIACDLADICKQLLKPDYNVIKEIAKICRICPSETNVNMSNVNDKEKLAKDVKTKSKKPFVTPIRARGFPRTVQQRSDLFRSRPPNTSRPPSLHVDDFVALETCGAQPTGPTGYNKFSRDILATNRIPSRGNRGRTFSTAERSVHGRQMSWWGTNLVRGPYQ